MSTIFDIAREAGVSITTVSRALNGYSDVSEITRRRVVEIAQSLNYYPSAAARNLQGRRTDTVAFAPLLREHMESEQFFKEFLGLLTLSAFRHDLSLLATVADTPSHTDKIYRELAGSGRVDGIILADIKPQDERIDLLGSLDLPFVAFGRTADYADLKYPLVDVDNAAGTRAVVDYLAGKGHSRLAYLSGPFNTSYSLHRYSGFRESLRQHNLPIDDRLVIADLQEPSDTTGAVARLLSLGENEHESKSLRPTAIVAANDHLAWQVIQELQRHGISVGSHPTGNNIAVTGYDDLPFAGYVQPPLTTVRQPIATISDILLDLLVMIIKHETESKKKVTLPAKAIRREPNEQVGMEKRANTGRAEQYVRWIGPMQALVAPELVIRASA
ncbi:MAG TPA: LacI family DNA-binding transcriptional regulator [Chloroflexia bacterium]|nr:LacI family DNA-binding transcriptional regulator [Chloroflexia bacterium]